MRKLKVVKKFERASLYKKSLFLFTLVLMALSFLFLTYVYKSMVIYERNLVDNYIGYLAESGKLSENINDNLFKVSSYEKDNAKITDGVKKLLKSDELVIKKNSKKTTDEVFAYDLKVGDKLVSTVSLKSTNTYQKMAILTINEWEVENIETFFEEGIFSYVIEIPSTYTLKINGKKVDDKDIYESKDVSGFERLTEYVEISKCNTYKISNLVYEPKIEILDKDGLAVDYTVKNGKIVVTEEFTKIEKLDNAKKYLKKDFDILTLAKNWSLFLTDDLGGTLHGLNKLTPYLIKDSYMYEMAYNWATLVDIQFVSDHVLKGFTNEEVKNFEIYNDNAFSCEVYLEKNMVVNGENKQDIMHDRLYFVYYENEYKLVLMKAVKE